MVRIKIKLPLPAYGQWAGNEAGHPYQSSRCAAEVYGDSMIPHQCYRPKGHGDRGLFCKQHAKKYPEASE